MSRIRVINPLAIASWVGDVGLGGGEPGDVALREVERLIFAYSYNWDSRDAQATALLFTESAEVGFFLDGAEPATHRTVGRDQLVEEMVARTEMLKRWRVETRHLMMNTVFGPSADGMVEAMTTAVIFWQQRPDHPAPQAVQTGYYRSWCVPTDLGWRFQRRETHMSGVFHPKLLYQKPE
ncbi:MAG: hypothetical protein GY929_09945 [Actinomycetia bacterium]|nr:hypothetical protein [Actinomycetes bacterium]